MTENDRHTHTEEEMISEHHKGIYYTCNVDANLYDKLEKILFAIRGLEGKTTKKDWINKAIKEKLERENSSNVFSKEKRLSFPIDHESLAEIEKRVMLLRKFRTSYSKKQWLVEAIYEKLDQDTKTVQTAIEKIKSSM